MCASVAFQVMLALSPLSNIYLKGKVMQKKVSIYKWDELEDRKPAYALVSNTDLVIIRYDESVSVLYGRCLHRGALMADGYIDR